MVRVLLLTRFEDLGASSRYRALQYLPYLRDHGFEVDVKPLLDNDYLERLYGGRRVRKLSIAKAILQRVGAMLQHRKYDVLWIEKEALPYVPGWLESFLLGRKTPYVVDFDDAVFHRFDRHRNPVIRKLLGKKYDRIMQGARMVVAGNAYIAERALRVGASSVELLPTVVDIDRYDPVPHHDSPDITFGWIGTPITAKYLEIVRPAIGNMDSNSNATLVAIGSGELDWNEPRLHVRQWTAGTEVDELRRLTAGLMPLEDTPFERGKCGLKLIQYMAVGLPVLASPVGVNSEIVEPDINGYLCDSEQDWRDAMNLLATNLPLRERLGKAGRKKIEEQFNLKLAAPRLATLLTHAANSKHE